MRHRTSAMIAALCAILMLCLVSPATQPVPPEGEGNAPAPVVTLLAEGQGELKPLRWQPQVGVPVRAKMTMGMDMALTIDGQAIPRVDLPEFVFTMVATASEPDASGRYLVETVYEDIELHGETEPMIRRAMMDAMAPLKGAKLTFRIDTRGVATDTNAGDLPPEILAMLGGEQGVRNMTEALSQPMPEEPVGVGARWQVEQEIRAPNAPVIKNSVVYELIRREGDTIELSMDGTQSGAPQEFDVGVPGAKAVLKSAEGTMRGSAYMRLNRLLPNRASNEGSVDFVMEVTENGRTQTLEQTVTVRFEIEHLDEDGAKPIDPADAG